MTQNTCNGVPSLQDQPEKLESLSSRRKSTVGSPTSAVFTPSAVPLQFPSHDYLPLLSPPRESLPEINGFTAPGFVYRSPSSSKKSSSPSRRRQASRSPERRVNASTNTWLANGHKSPRQNKTDSRGSGVQNMQGRTDSRQLPITARDTGRPGFKSHKSNQSQSNSLPSTPNHHPRLVNGGGSRSPSPPSCLLDSPRSAASEPVTTTQYRPPQGGCEFEKGMAGARRRIPYSLGMEPLKAEKARKDRMEKSEEGKLTKEITELFLELKPPEESKVRRRKFLAKLERILEGKWPDKNTKVHAFGSTENHLSMKDSDVDVCITTKAVEMENTCMLAHLFSINGMQNITCIPGAKVPIVKIWDPEYQVACDININNTLALDNTRMIKTYVEIDERVRPLGLIIKHWTKQRKLNDAAGGGTLSSYTWICIILNFLQTRNPPILPSLHARPHKKRPNKAGVDVSFDDDIDSLRGFGKGNQETLGELLFDFFKLYGHDFNYEGNVISVRHGKMMTREEKGWDKLPKNQNQRFCVEEPFNVIRNLGNTADDTSMKGIHMEFRRAHKILCESANLAECCEEYNWPVEEFPNRIQPQHAPSRPVTLSRSNSNHARRNGFTSNHNRNNRNYNSSWNNRGNQNRRSSSAAAFNGQPQLQQPFVPRNEYFGALVSHEHYIQAVQLQMAQLQAQQQLAHMQAAHHALSNQQSTPNLHQTGQHSLSNQQHQDAIAALQHFSLQYYYGGGVPMNLFYPGLTQNDHPSQATSSPPVTPAASDGRPDRSDGRQGLQRGRRSYPQTPRSHSQPPPAPASFQGNFTRTAIPVVPVPSSTDDEFGDHSSNGNPPETPTEEEGDEYIGYYTVDDSMQQMPPDVAVLDAVEVESFVEQRQFVERQKRLSESKLPSPMLSTIALDASPAQTNVRRHLREATGQSLTLNPPVMPGPIMVNGNLAKLPHSAPYSSTSFTYDHSPVGYVPVDSRSNGIGLGLSVPDAAKQSEQKEVSNRAENNHDPKSSIAGVSTNNIKLTSAQVAAGLAANAEASNIKTSPRARQRAAKEQLIWSNSRSPPQDATKARGAVSHEDLNTPATPSTPSKKGAENGQRKDSPKTKPKPLKDLETNGVKNVKSDPVPPTPSSANERNGQQHGSGKKKGGKNSTTPKSNNSEPKAEPKPGSAEKSEWRKSTNKKSKKKKGNGNGNANANNNANNNGQNKQEQPVKESERKGG